jgi:hypothetical protein
LKRIAVTCAIVLGLLVAYVVAHLALIEIGREVIVLRTEDAEGARLETRLWIVDDGEQAWIHGGDSRWMQNLRENPVVEVERGGKTQQFRAVPVPGPHQRVHELLREKYGIADGWVRFIGGDEGSVPVRLEPLQEVGSKAPPREAQLNAQPPVG